MTILADTSFLLAALDKDDPHHHAAKTLVERPGTVFVTPVVVLPEVCYLAHKYMGAETEGRFLQGVLKGDVVVEWGQSEDLHRAVEILQGRPDLGMVDATLIATAERLKIKQVATFDRRHFNTIRPRHCPAFEILP